MALLRPVGRVRLIIPLFLIAVMAVSGAACGSQAGPGSAAWREQAETYMAKEASIIGRVQAQNKAVSDYRRDRTSATETQTADFVSAPTRLQALHDELAALTPPDELESAHAHALGAIDLCVDSAKAAVWGGQGGSTGQAAVDEYTRLGQDADREMQASTAALKDFTSKYRDQLK